MNIIDEIEQLEIELDAIRKQLVHDAGQPFRGMRQAPNNNESATTNIPLIERMAQIDDRLLELRKELPC